MPLTDPEIRARYGQRISAARAAAELTQRDVADRLNALGVPTVTPQAVSRWENGEVAPPTRHPTRTHRPVRRRPLQHRRRGRLMARLLTQRAAATYLGINVRRFRAICRAGDGPRVFNPDGGRALYAVAVLDLWAADRDDRTQDGAA